MQLQKLGVASGVQRARSEQLLTAGDLSHATAFRCKLLETLHGVTSPNEGMERNLELCWR